MASVISQHTQEPPHGGFPARLGGSSTGPPEPVTWVTAREEEVTLYGLVASFITDIVGGGKKRAFAHMSPPSQSGDVKNRSRWNGEVIRAERQDPGGEAKSQRGSCTHGILYIQLHSDVSGAGLKSSLTLEGFHMCQGFFKENIYILLADQWDDVNTDQSQTRQKRSEVYRQSVPRTNKKRNFEPSQIFIMDAH